VVWLNRLEADHDNFRAALRWSLDQGEAEMALRLAIALMRFWLAHAHLSEGRRWLERALTSSNGLPIALRAKALFEAGGLADQQGDHEQQRALQEASLLMYQQLNDPLGIAAVLNCLGNIEPDGARARALHEESLWLYREQGDTVGVAKVLINLSCDVASQGNYEQAQTLLEESLALSRQISDSTGIGYALINMGCNALQQGHHVQAVAHLRKSLESFYQLRDRRLIAECLEELANATAHEHPRRAAQLWGAAATLRDAIGVIMPARDPATNELYQATARGAIGDGAFDAAWAEGQAMLLEQVVVVALEEQREMSSPQRAKAVQV
jgi:tetratricopeptide (TPR) repeat protein